MEPREVIGSVDTSEFLAAVAVAANLGFLLSPGSQGLKWTWMISPVYVVLYGVWAAALAYSVRAHRRDEASKARTESESAEGRQPVRV
jgi:hypothetical protein